MKIKIEGGWGGCISRNEYILTGINTYNYNSWSGNGILLTRSQAVSLSFHFHILPFFFFLFFFFFSPFYFLEVNTRDAAEDILSSILWRNTWEGLNEIQAQPKHLLKEKKLDVTGSGSGSGFLKGRCLKKAFTAPVTPSSFSMAFASSTARSFTYNDS